MIVVPLPGSLWARIEPPCRSAKALTTLSPSPRPRRSDSYCPDEWCGTSTAVQQRRYVHRLAVDLVVARAGGEHRADLVHEVLEPFGGAVDAAEPVRQGRRRVGNLRREARHPEQDRQRRAQLVAGDVDEGGL